MHYCIPGKYCRALSISNNALKQTNSGTKYIYRFNLQIVHILSFALLISGALNIIFVDPFIVLYQTGTKILKCIEIRQSGFH